MVNLGVATTRGQKACFHIGQEAQGAIFTFRSTQRNGRKLLERRTGNRGIARLAIRSPKSRAGRPTKKTELQQRPSPSLYGK